MKFKKDLPSWIISMVVITCFACMAVTISALQSTPRLVPSDQIPVALSGK